LHRKKEGWWLSSQKIGIPEIIFVLTFILLPDFDAGLNFLYLSSHLK